jgi:hypothetical protein
MTRSDFAIGIRYGGPDDHAAPWFRGALEEIRHHRLGSVAIEIEGRCGDRQSGSLAAVSEKPKDTESAGVIELEDGRLIPCNWIASFRLLPPGTTGPAGSRERLHPAG